MQPTWDVTGGPGSLTSRVSDPLGLATHPDSVFVGWTVPATLVPFDDLGSLAAPGPKDGYLVIDPVIRFAVDGAATGPAESAVARLNASLQVLPDRPAPGAFGASVGAILFADGSVTTSAPHDVQVPSYAAGTGSGTYSTKMWLEVQVHHEGAELIYQYQYNWLDPSSDLDRTAGAVVERIKGDVELLTGDTWGPIGRGPLRNDDEIRTGPNSFATLVFTDGSTFRVKPNSGVRLAANVLVMHYGDAWFNIEKHGKSFEVHTPTTVAGDLGTTFAATVSPDGTTRYEVAEGSIVVTVTSTNRQVEVTQGNAVTVTADLKIDVAPFDVDAMQAEWQAVEDAMGVPLSGSTDRTAGDPDPLLLGILAAIAVALVALVALALITIGLRTTKRGC